MKSVRKYMFAVLLTLLAPAMLSSQCFDPLVNQGIYLMRQKNKGNDNYKQAIDKFIAARFCLDSRPSVNLDSLVRMAQDAWVADLAKARQAAIAEKDKAESLLRIAEQLQLEAHQYAEKAKQAAIGTEANRLALVAENEIRAGHYWDALDLAFLAAQLSLLSTGALSEEIELTFGRAVFYYKSQTIFNSPAPITQYQVLPSDEGLLVALKNGSIYWASPDGQSSRLLGSHPYPVRSLALSPDGRYALSCSAGPTALLWNLQRFAPPLVLEGHLEDVLGAIFAPEGDKILTWSRDKTARLWNLEGQLLATLAGHQGSIYEGAFSPDGRHVLTRSSDRTARIWTATGSLIAEIGGHGGYLYSACFSPDGNTVLTAGADSTATLRTLRGRFLHSYAPHPNVVKEARFTPNGQVVICRPLEGNLRAWNTEGGLLAGLHQGSPPSGLLFHPGQKAFLSWSDIGDIQLWAPDGQCELSLKSDHPKLLKPSWSNDGTWILASSEDGATQLWSRSGRQSLYVPPSAPTSLPARFDSDGRWFILAKNDYQLIRCPVPSLVLNEMQHSPPLPLGRQLALSERYMIPPLIFETITQRYRATP